MIEDEHKAWLIGAVFWGLLIAKVILLLLRSSRAEQGTGLPTTRIHTLWAETGAQGSRYYIGTPERTVSVERDTFGAFKEGEVVCLAGDGKRWQVLPQEKC